VPASRVDIVSVKWVCRRLRETYGTPRLGNPDNPLDDLVYILLSNRTPPARAQRIYEALKDRFPTWRLVAETSVETLEEVLKPAGFSSRRAAQIKAILQRLYDDYANYSLDYLRGVSEEEAYRYLRSLPGVSHKVAKCVMMYTLGIDVLPVDVHVHRIASRLGWTTARHPDQSHSALEKLIPLGLRYAFHVGCVAHGRALCRSTPICEPCPLKAHCAYFRATVDESGVCE
jgi:endonuclease-3